ncbi:hypothetical protein [Cobetia sp. 10Alg 146]|uniref:hypothetical protein n=1 Tax=Cobetia sp. 10Alg 146 TaxID=3040019 RepID=UPI00244974B7|nr:hypothetical protein [Cobetia sp. 10Alg 146]
MPVLSVLLVLLVLPVLVLTGSGPGGGETLQALIPPLWLVLFKHAHSTAMADGCSASLS